MRYSKQKKKEKQTKDFCPIVDQALILFLRTSGMLFTFLFYDSILSFNRDNPFLKAWTKTCFFRLNLSKFNQKVTPGPYILI